MGLIVGVPVLSVGLVVPGWKAYLIHCLRALVIVVGTALVAGLGALACAYLVVSESSVSHYWCPFGVADRVAFVRAGIMHDFTYLGAATGIITGSVFLVVRRIRAGRLPG